MQLFIFINQVLSFIRQYTSYINEKLQKDGQDRGTVHLV